MAFGNLFQEQESVRVSRRSMAIGLVGCLILGAGVCILASRDYLVRKPQAPPEPAMRLLPPLESEAKTGPAEVKAFCGACHATPTPDSFPRDAWPQEVTRGFVFYEQSNLHLEVPSQTGVIKYYLDRAPADLPALRQFKDNGPPWPGPWRRIELTEEGDTADPPSVANVRFVHLFDDRRLDLLVCEMGRGQVFLLRPYETSPRYALIGDNLGHPAHAEVVDLDRDGHRDVLVADLGSYLPTDARNGSVLWLRGSGGGSFTTIPLALDLGRVADVRAADFDSDGDNDLVVAVFGWHKAGEILYMENRSSPTNPSKSEFVTSTIDRRHGAIHVPVADLNGDGRPDFVAVFGQEHETVEAFLNQGSGRFEHKTVFQAPHPAFGSSGIDLADLDHDGDLDVLLTNGDVMDAPLLRPDQGVRWLENRGAFPFEVHELATVYGAHRAQAADLDGDGDLDIAACSFLPPSSFGQYRRQQKLDAVVILEQTRPGVFVRHSLETVHCDHPTLDLGDFDGDGAVDLVVGRFVDRGPKDREEAKGHDAPGGRVFLWRNMGRKP